MSADLINSGMGWWPCLHMHSYIVIFSANANTSNDKPESMKSRPLSQVWRRVRRRVWRSGWIRNRRQSSSSPRLTYPRGCCCLLGDPLKVRNWRMYPYNDSWYQSENKGEFTPLSFYVKWNCFCILCIKKICTWSIGSHHRIKKAAGKQELMLK